MAMGLFATTWLAIASCCGFLRVSFAFQSNLTPAYWCRPREPNLGAPPPHSCLGRIARTTRLGEMKRPILDRLATLVFNLENDRVSKSSVVDEKGRSGEPMEWADENSLANRFSSAVSSNGVGYAFKQAVADLVAGEYNSEERSESIRKFVRDNPVAVYSFTTCPFCRRAKDFLEERSIPYASVELDLLPGNDGNEIRAELGRMTKRTSVPSIFIGGEYIGGCNDGPGLLPLAEENDGKRLNELLKNAGVSTT